MTLRSAALVVGVLLLQLGFALSYIECQRDDQRSAAAVDELVDRGRQAARERPIA